jgi:hypothetical protein
MQEEVDRFQARYVEQHVPEMQADTERWLQALGAARLSFFELASDRKHLRLHGRIGLDFAAPK